MFLGGSKMAIGGRKQTVWAPQIKNLAKTLEPHLAGKKKKH
jgi:hypothetical protein